MSIDRFGSRRVIPPDRYLIQRDGTGNYRFRRRRLRDIQDPEAGNDAANKRYVDALEDRMRVFAEESSHRRLGEYEAMLRIRLDEQYANLIRHLERYAFERDSENNVIRIRIATPPEHDFDVANKKYIDDRTPLPDSDGNMSFREKRISHIADPENDSDAVSKGFLARYAMEKQNELASRIASMPGELVAVLNKNLESMVSRQTALDQHLTSTMSKVDLLKTQVSVINAVLGQLRGQLIVSLRTKPYRGGGVYMLVSGADYYKSSIEGDVISCSMINSTHPGSKSDAKFKINGKHVEHYPAPIQVGDMLTFVASPFGSKDGHVLNIELVITYKLISGT